MEDGTHRCGPPKFPSSRFNPQPDSNIHKMMISDDQPDKMTLDETTEFQDMVVIVSLSPFLQKFADRRRTYPVPQSNRVPLQHGHRHGHEGEHEGGHHWRIHYHRGEYHCRRRLLLNSRNDPKNRPGASIPAGHVQCVGSGDDGTSRSRHVPSRVRLSIAPCQGYDRPSALSSTRQDDQGERQRRCEDDRYDRVEGRQF